MFVTTRCALAVSALMLLVSFAEADVAARDDQKTKTAPAKSVYDFTVKNIDGKDVSLDTFRGDVLLIVNVASRCGLTDRSYAGMEKIYAKYKDKGLRILAFPANNFRKQEPGTNEEIKTFCTKKKNAKYDLFAKVSVKGDDQCPLYQFLSTHADSAIAGDVTWNFQKYLVGRDGTVIAKFAPRLNPDSKEVTAAIESALAVKP